MPYFFIAFALGFLTCLALILLLRFLAIIGPWFKAMTSRAPVPFLRLVGMRLRGTDTRLMVEAHIQLRLRNKQVALHDLETVYIKNRNQIRTAHDLIDLAAEKGLH